VAAAHFRFAKIPKQLNQKGYAHGKGGSHIDLRSELRQHHHDLTLSDPSVMPTMRQARCPELPISKRSLVDRLTKPLRVCPSMTWLRVSARRSCTETLTSPWSVLQG
jgi:hypothetical protein